MSFGNFFCCFGLERRSPRQGMVEGGSEGIDITSNILWFTKKSFGRHIVGCSPNLVLLAERRARSCG